jgi:hypothetical protein
MINKASKDQEYLVSPLLDADNELNPKLCTSDYITPVKMRHVYLLRFDSLLISATYLSMLLLSQRRLETIVFLVDSSEIDVGNNKLSSFWVTGMQVGDTDKSLRLHCMAEPATFICI